MNVAYPSIVDSVLTGAINLSTATLKVQLVGAYVYDSTHTVLADLTHTIGTPTVATVDHVAGGGLFVDPVTVPAIAAGSHVLAAVLYVDNGTTRPLAAYIDRRADRVLIDLTTNGGAIHLSWLDAALVL